jgi:hypothetical protein
MIRSRNRELYLLGYRFSGQMATVALIGLFLVTAIVIASPVLILRFQYFQ